MSTQQATSSSSATTEGQAAQGAVSLLDEIIQKTKVPAESAALVREGVKELVSQLMNTAEGVQADPRVVDKIIAKLDERIGEQMDEILHAPKLQQLESTWRSIKFLVDKTNFRENNELWVLNAGKEELAEDLAKAPELPQSGLYDIVYRQAYDQHGATPYSVMIGNYDYGTGNADMTMLENMGAVAAMAHAPFVAAASPQMFGKESFMELADIPNVQEIFKTKPYIKFRSFRESDDSRSVGLTMPRFLLRTPYSADSVERVKKFNYAEKTPDHESFLWGNAAFAFASRLTDSFAKHRWFTRIIGPRAGGQVEGLPLHLFKSADGATRQKIPTEVTISETLEYELAESGFMPLVFRVDSDNAAFFSAKALKKPETFANTPEGKAAETNARMNAELPYMLIISRLAHYLKVMQREEIGSAKAAVNLQDELQNWIRQYVSADDTATESIKAIRPLRDASIKVVDLEGRPGWYKVDIKVRPHVNYQGAFFTLSLVGTLGNDKK